MTFTTGFSGSRDAEEFVRRLHGEHGSALYGWALRRFSDPRDAEEVVAEALVKAWRHYDQFDPGRGSERSWVFGIVRNAAADHHRRQARHLQLVSDEPVPDEVDDPLEIERVAETTVIRDALFDLSAQHRDVIVEAFFAGRTAGQISEKLGIPPGTVKSRLYYGMRSLRTVLEERGVLQ